MPFKSALSTAQQTAKRSGIYSAIRYVAVNTPVVQLQFNPSANANGQAAAQIGFSTTLQGSTANVLRGMSVYITPTSDYRSDLINQPENCLKTDVRKSPTSAILYIGWTAFQWTTAHYVTVVSNFELNLKKTRLIGTTIYKNVDETYRAPLPRLYNWYHDVVVTSASTVNYSVSPTEEAMASGASISSRTWATVVNGTVTTGVSTSATPTFSLPLGVHWLHCTTTDSNGNANWITLMVAVVPDTYASIVTKLVAGTTTNSLTNGIEADIVTTTDITIVPGSAAIIFDDIVYKGNWREQVVKAFGWLDGEVEQSITGDNQYGLRTEYRTRLLGIRELAQTLRIPAFPFKYNASPTTWGQVARCTVYDAIWYALSEHSTIASLAAIDFPSNYTDYQYNPGIQIPEGAILDSVDSLAFFASGGMVNYSPNGELYFRQSLLYATSGRDSAVTYATYETQDGTGWRKTQPPVNRFPLSAIRAGFATFNTTTNQPRVYNSLAPAEATPTALQETLDGIIMTKNLADSAANTEAGKLAINHFFASVEAAGVAAELIAGYSTVEPSCFQWHKFTIGSGETLDGSSFSSSTRFLCVQVSSTYNQDAWAIVNSAEFREETDGGSNYARETDFVPLGTDVVYPTYPPGTYSVHLSDFDTPTDYYGDDFATQRQGWEDPTVEPETAAENQNPGEGVSEIISTPLPGGVIQTTKTYSGSVLLRVSGSGYIARNITGSQVDSFSVPANLDAFTSGSTILESGKSYRVVVAGDVIHGAGGLRADAQWITSDAWATQSQQNNIDFQHLGRIAADDQTYDGATHTYEYTIDGHGAVLALKDFDLGYTDNSGSYAVTVYEVLTIQADALYYTDDGWETQTKSPNGSFLYVDGNPISNTEVFNSSHVYDLMVTGVGSKLSLSFTDNYDSLYNNNENTSLRIEIFQL